MVLWLAALVGGALAASSAGQGPPGGSPPGLDKAIAAKQKHAERMLDKPGVAGIGVGLNPAGKPVIRIYKEKPDVADLPDELEGVAVESVTTGVIEPRDHTPTHRFERPVPIGISAGLSGVATGTLGARVTDGTNVYALSNNHVFAGVNSANIGDPIISPGDFDGGSDPADRIGTLAAYHTIDFDSGTNTMDAAIALTLPANVGTSTPADGYGLPSPVTAPAFVGQAVQKYGRTTGLQLGDVTATNLSVDVCYAAFGDFCIQEARFVGQVSVSPGPFSAPGDSGSLIVTQGGNQPVALLFAGGDGLTIGSPIDLVLQRFGVTIDGSAPPEGPPSAPTALAALAGDASATLSWSAPTFDGGTPISGYRIYRGTSAGGESFLQSVGNVTSFVDTGLSNSTTYYYKVSAENANGEGAFSNEASTTPTSLVLPAEPLPAVDAFNRANENPLSDAGRWTNGISATGGVETGLFTTANTLACSKTTTCTAWRNAAQYGPDAESWARVSTLPGTGNAIRLYVRVQQPGSSAYDGYMLRTNQLAGTDQVFLDRIDNSAVVNRLTVNQELAAGDVLLLRAKGTFLEAWRNDGSAWSRLGVVADSTYAAAGFSGVGIRGTAGRLDDFGARSLSQNPPGAPTGLTATAGDDLVELTWSAPAFDGGSPVTHYRIFRGTSPGGESFLAASTATTYTDANALNGTTYYYKVSAENGNGEGPLSNEASATPTDVVPPDAPLPTVDSFDRANENPLSDAGRWTNGISATGGVETGLFTTANTLACSKTTTCTAWRNAAQYGPDAESWARVSTLPGTGNAIRLYVRVQQPGSSAYDGYMLRTNQLAGTDQVFLDRIDNSAVVNRLTVNQELAAGDVLLLRAKGTFLEAWRNDGSAWSRLGVVADSTYAAAGFSGVGIRGTAGRLDDFGARTYGVAPPTAPSAPSALQATAGNAQVSLTWSAPSSDGGSPLTSYTLYRGTSPNPTGVHASGVGSTSYLDTSAVNGTTYYYRVSASNAVGESPSSNEVSATPSAPATAPSAPSALQATAGNAQVSLTWSAPSSDGGSPLTSYTLYRGTSPNPTGVHASGVGSTSYLDTSAVNGTTYYYRVSASNAVGESPSSNEVSATPSAPATAPSAPSALQATAGNAQVSLTWSAPSSDGGSPLTSYTLYRGTSPNPTGVHASGVGSTSYLDTSAVNGTTYYYRVSASNAVGESPSSNEVSATPSAPATAPSAPSALQATAGNAQVSLTWSAPSSDGGSPLTSYTLYRGTSPNPTGVHASGVGSTSYLDTSAVNGTTYYYRVSASNAVGESPSSNEVSATPSAPATAPSAPSALQATAGNAQVSLTWSAPSSDGGSPLTSYTLYRGTSPNPTGVHASGVGSTSYLDTSAVNGTTYYYRVSASNAVGESPSSNEVSATPSAPATAPSAPSALQATAGNAQVSLTWSAPSSDGGSPLTSYTLYRGTSPNPTGVHASGVGSTSYLDTSAVNGTTYYYRVSASNAVGESPSSNEVSATPTDLVLPIEPLAILDPFNRANENPLSFGGRWGNGILGAAERSLRVISNQLASDRNTTTTAWWNQAQFGPTCESYATMAIRPGNNNTVRLYVRLQTPGSAVVDGYMLLYTQLSGTDQVAVYRVTNGALTQLSTVNREIGAGTRLLLRAQGTALEAWIREGVMWTRVNRVTDSTYSTGGYAGVGIRGKTGRLDDFGAR